LIEIQKYFVEINLFLMNRRNADFGSILLKHTCISGIPTENLRYLGNWTGGTFIQDFSCTWFPKYGKGEAKKLWPKKDPDEGYKFWEKRGSDSDG
jgi:hypothetical protein